MKSQDIVIMLKLVSLEDQIKHGQHDEPTISDPFALRSLEDELGISKTEISAVSHRILLSNPVVARRRTDAISSNSFSTG